MWPDGNNAQRHRCFCCLCAKQSSAEFQSCFLHFTEKLPDFGANASKFAKECSTYFAWAQSYYLYNQKFRMGGNA